MKKEMLINVLQPEECRIAIVEDGVLEELYVERTSQESYVGNIYKGRIVNIEPSIQAAFVDFGIGRNGFLHVSDVEPAYYRHLEQGRGGHGGRRSPRDRGRGGPPPARRRREEPEDTYPREAATTEEPAAEPTAEGEQLTAPDRRQEPRRTRGRGGSRGRSRSRRSQREETANLPVEEPREEAAPEFADEPTIGAEEAEMPPTGPDDEPKEPPRTEYMDSAEHRTEEPRESNERGGAPSMPTDDDIFFPRPTPAAEEADSEPAHAESTGTDDDAGLFFSRSVPDSPEMSEMAEVESEGFATTEETFTAEEEVMGEEVVSAPPMPDLEEEPIEDFEEEEYEHRRRRSSRDDRRGGPRRRMSGRPGFGRPKPLIQDIFRRGQEVLVQVIKEGIGTKGPTLSTYISIAGRYLVLMPGLNRVGVSRKIVDEEARRRLREVFHELQPPKGLGFIIRTAGMDKTKKELQRDLAYLSRLWQVVVRRIRKLKSPAEIYQESDMITRTIRDTFTSDIDTIWVDEPTAFEHAQEFMQIVMPRYASRIKHYTGSEPLFHKYGIEEEIARIQRRHVPLPHGGSIVIDQTEALVAIDVNSGNFRADNNAEETAYRMNLHAAREIARQLRLRDLGGVIVNDFIDMREEKHRRDVERALREAVKRDRARTKILKISAFGLIEMTRQRIRPSLKRSVYQDCPHCHGTAQVKTCESMSIDVMRMLQLAAHRENIQRIQVRVQDEVANYLLNRKRKEITRLEETGSLQILISPAAGVSPELLEFVCYDNNNNEVKFLPNEETTRPRRR
jgi:ribonuclease E